MALYQAALLDCMQGLRALVALHGVLTTEEEIHARTRASDVAVRIAWILELGISEPVLLQLLRTATTNLVYQRSTTYQATQEALSGEREFGGGDVGDEDFPPGLPRMARAFSCSATTFSQVEVDPQPEPHSPLPNVPRRTLAMGASQLAAMLAEGEALSSMPLRRLL